MIRFLKSIFKSRLNSLLLFSFTLIVLIKCKKKTDVTSENLLNSKEHSIIIRYKSSDSLELTVEAQNKENIVLNFPSYTLDYYPIRLTNHKSENLIKTKVNREYQNEVILYLGADFKDGKMNTYKHYYLLKNETKSLKFISKKGDLIPRNNTNFLNVDTLFNEYKKNEIKIFNDEMKTEIIENELKDLYENFNSFYKKSNNSIAVVLNKYHFVKNTQMLKTNDSLVTNFLMKVDTLISGETLHSILYNYVDKNILNFNYDSLDVNTDSSTYSNLVAIGIYNYLKHEDHKGDKKYKPALDWLKTTQFYKKDSVNIKKKIIPLSNDIFKTKIKSLTFQDVNDNDLNINQIIKNNKSDYYLIDFWATWCSPCIKGIKKMKTINIPKNINVISVSVDKKRDKDKWKKFTKDFGLDISFWLDENDSNNQYFLNFIEMKNIPRYLLFDKNLELIDQAFYHPNDSQFLPKLQDIKNYKYW